VEPTTLVSIPLTITTFLTGTNAQTGNETLYVPASILLTQASIPETGATGIPSLTYTRPETAEELAIAGMNAALDHSQFEAMESGPGDLRSKYKQCTFVPLPNQNEAEEMVKRAVGYFHNSYEHGLAGVHRCYMIPANPVASSGLRARYLIICEMIHPGSQSRSGPFTYLEAFGTEAGTVKEVKKNFYGEASEGSLWGCALPEDAGGARDPPSLLDRLGP
jgi:hypothetical protein